jgi:hypothetical protein
MQLTANVKNAGLGIGKTYWTIPTAKKSQFFYWELVG